MRGGRGGERGIEVTKGWEELMGLLESYGRKGGGKKKNRGRRWLKRSIGEGKGKRGVGEGWEREE